MSLLSAAGSSSCCTWTFRPSALSVLQQAYKTINVNRLFELYAEDNRRAQQQQQQSAGSRAPPPPPPRREPTGTACKLRTCQWNINYFAHARDSILGMSDDEGDDGDDDIYEKSTALVAQQVAQTIKETDADVIVLNEFGSHPSARQPESALLTALLEEAGYQVLIAKCAYPTAIATRLNVLEKSRFDLDDTRAAVKVTVETTPDDGSGSQQQQQQPVVICGIHLEVEDEGSYRLDEMNELFQRIGKDVEQSDERPVLITGDFNQQRKEDYTKEEWGLILENKQHRGAAGDDGVASLLKAKGFSCIWDRGFRESGNWRDDHPPPSTHWSGTIVDYSYGRGKGLRATNVFVSPSNLSDHRLIVTDWTWC